MFCSVLFFFFFNDTATTEIYTLSLHDALPISVMPEPWVIPKEREAPHEFAVERSEEHTSELQSLAYLVCRLLLEKKTTHCPHSTGRSAPSGGTRRGHFAGAT